jgi:hypothetical protein
VDKSLGARSCLEGGCRCYNWVRVKAAEGFRSFRLAPIASQNCELSREIEEFLAPPPYRGDPRRMPKTAT